jgi:hypothetical protein
MRTISSIAKLSYTAFDDVGAEICSAEVPLGFTNIVATFHRGDQLKYKLVFDRDERMRNMFKIDKSTFISNPFYVMNSNDESIGYICGKRKKSFWSGGYWYYEYLFCGRQYLTYSIGMGKEGYKVPIYENERQIALIEKDVVTYDNKSTYNVYVLTDEMLEMVLLFNLYYDFTRFGNRNRLVYKTKKVEYIHSPKVLKTKYDPNFKLKF